MRGCRVVIPEKLQQKVLDELHRGHPGVVRMKMQAQNHVWWPENLLSGVLVLTQHARRPRTDWLGHHCTHGFGEFPSGTVEDRGRQNRPSAFACFAVGQQRISYEYAENSSAHLCMHYVAKGSIPWWDPRIVVKGLWSVSRTNSLPYRYLWNFLIPKPKESASFSRCV